MFLSYNIIESNQSKLVAIDTETFLINEGTTWPTVVCLSGYMPVQATPFLCVGEDIKSAMCHLIENGFTFILQNAKYDLGVLWNSGVITAEQIFELLDTGRIIDTVTNEKLLNLAEFGDTNSCTVQGVSKVVKLSLDALVNSYLGIDISEAKKGADSWRLRYSELYGKPLSEWPQEAVKYSTEDSLFTYQVYMAQLEREARLIKERGFNDVLRIGPLKNAVDFALGCMTERGNVIDQQRLPEVMAALEAKLDPSRMTLLYELGLLSPAQEGKPYKNGAKDHTETCLLNPLNPNFIRNTKGVCDCPVKRTADVAEKKNLKELRQFVTDLASQNPEIVLALTETGEIQVDAAFFEKYSGYHEGLLLFQEREKDKKLKSTYIDHLYYPEGDINAGQPVQIIRGGYNNLVDTGRTSCSASKLFPSWNSQNIPNFVRPIIVPRPGFCLCSVDIAAMELGTLAQTCINLFQHSRMADLINAGIDLHAYLGSQIAYSTDNAFAQAANYYHSNYKTGKSLHDDTYELFKGLDNHETPVDSPAFVQLFKHTHKDKAADYMPTCKDFYKHYRTLAKPTGLGYPGGLGALTFIAYARTTYGVTVTLEEAKNLKNIWLNTYPEMNQYREFIEKDSLDPYSGLFKYTVRTKNGDLNRTAAAYCACSNGLGLQSPSAIGATLAAYRVTQACYDRRQKSPLYHKMFPTMFVHDEVISELTDEGPELNTYRVKAKQDIIERSMRAITPDVKTGTEATLMAYWDKGAKAKKDESGNLLIWDGRKK